MGVYAKGGIRMSYNEAKEDGVRIDETGLKTLYYPKCSVCGSETKSWNYLRDLNYTCKTCKTVREFSEKETRAFVDEVTKDKRFDRAVERVSKHTGKRFKQYKRAIEIVKQNLYNEKWFDSTEEIMAAIELIKNNYKIKHQTTVGRYRVDFLIPEEKIVLEIDGSIYHTSKTKDKETLRDNLIKFNLGDGWEVIRVSDTDLNTNITKLTKAIKGVKEKRELLRKQNNGNLPKWYTDRDLIY